MAEGEDKGIKTDRAGAAGGGAAGRNFLLVIAIDEYEHCPKLNNCVKDAREFIEVLTGKYQFEPDHIYTLTNAEATRPNIHTRLRELKSKIKPTDNLVIYYSGHGETEDNVGYWVPVDAHPEREWEYFSTDEIKRRLDAIDSFHTFVIVDACFSGSLFSTYKSVTPGYETKRSRWGLAASHSRERALDGAPGENSPFAEKLLKQLKESRDNLPVQELATEIIKRVEQATDGRQTPVFKPLNVKGDDSGQYVFHLKENETADWAACRQEGTLASYQAFLAKYPNSAHAETARSRIGELTEEAAWRTATEANTILSYYQYNQRYPGGKYQRQALEAIRRLEEEQAWTHARQRNSLAGYLEYKTNYPESRFSQEVDEQIQHIIASQQEPNTWQQAKRQDTIDAYETYLRQYPDGGHAQEARTAIEELKRKAAAAEESRREEESWRAARAAGTEDAYRRYQQAHPRGQHASEAETALAKLRDQRAEAEAARRQKEQEEAQQKRREQARKEAEAAWAVARQAGTIAAVKGFLRQYPDAPPAAEAKTLLQGLQHTHRQKQWQSARRWLPAIAGILVILVVIWGITQRNKNTGSGNQEDLAAGIDTPTTQTTNDTLSETPDPIPSREQNTSEETEAASSPPTPSLTHQWRGDELIVRVSAGSPPYRLLLLRNGQEKYNQNMPGAGSRTIALAEYRKDPGAYEIQVEDSQGQKTTRSIRIDPPRATTSSGTVTLGGKTYRTVRLAGKTWMAQNLDYDIPGSSWYHSGLKSSSERSKYGRLYTWEAAKKACAAVGWRLPADQEWRSMAKQFGGANDDASDGGKAAYQALIEGGSSGFSALLGGGRGPGGGFDSLGDDGSYWSATEFDAGGAWLYSFGRDTGKLSRRQQ